MAGLRKMLGNINDTTLVSLMNMIETQSASTLAKWALDYVEEHVLMLCHHAFVEDMKIAIQTSRQYINQERTSQELKKVLKDTKVILKDVHDPVNMVAIRAILTACATYDTPTNALGFTFYAVAAIVYSEVGLSESKQKYDQLAKEKFKDILYSFQLIAVNDEVNPVKVKWYC